MAIVTPLKTAAEQQLVQQYADSKAELPGGPAVRKLREDAFAGFEAKGLPHRRLESWRYTDLRTLLRELASRDIAIVVVDHGMPFLLPMADRVICLDAGKIIAVGMPAEVVADPTVRAAYLGSAYRGDTGP